MKCRAKDDTKRSKGGATGPLVFVAIGLLVLLPPCYVLSDGPVMGLQVRECLPAGTYDTFFSPLVRVSKQWGPLDDALCWYESWFYTDAMLRAEYPERYP